MKIRIKTKIKTNIHMNLKKSECCLYLTELVGGSKEFSLVTW